MQPYLLAYCEQKTNRLAAGVLTAIVRIGPRKTLFATCKHVLTQTDQLFIVDENGIGVEPKGLVTISTQKPGLDLIFLFIRQDVPSGRIRINESWISRDTQLTHARNCLDETEVPSPFATHSAAARPSHLRAELALSGRQTFYRVLEMDSWPGVSGSALWDKFGLIRGMVCGGDSTESRLKDEISHLVYIPIKTIMKEASIALRDPEVRAMMRE